ncbi:MAG TPA: protein kinase [Thermoanaerobaculia bacterium]|nr:protein kinase [Thermoanaerobaculia bacterium]
MTDFLRRYLEEPIDGKYEILERLGAGGMGEVYKVRHTFLGALRVVKVIRPQISESREAHDRFLREARLATKVQHPNVATLHDFSALPDGSHYMVWEYIEGENLAQRLKSRNTLPPRYAASLAIQALHGLDAIHRAGIIHRDISPENLMITRDGHGDERVKIIDLGVAKTDEPLENATQTGMFVGKLRYASPEHMGFLGDNERIDGRADLYSLAIVLYEMLSGRPPFQATSPHEYFLLHSKETEFKPLDIPPGLPGGAELEQLLHRALARDRNKRFANAREFARALEDLERRLPDPSLSETMAVAAPGDETMRLTDPDTLHAPTLRTPLPAEQTRRVPMAAPVIPPAVRRGGSLWPFVGVMAVLLLMGGIAGALVVRDIRAERRRAAETSQPAGAAAPREAQSSSPAPTATTSTEPVTPMTTESAAVPSSTVIETVAEAAQATDSAPAPAPAPVPPQESVQSSRRPARLPVRAAAERSQARVPERAARPSEPEPEPQPVSGGTYIDGGGGDSDANDQLLASLRQRLSGVSRVSVEGSGDPLQVRAFIAAIDQHVTISPGADVVIQFSGTLERLGRGRKRRAAEATIRKGGRVIFRYQLPAEEYRVGDTPAEAFARVVLSAFER